MNTMNMHHPVTASVIIVSFNTRDILRNCLHHLYQAIGQQAIEVIVVDNGSVDGSADMVADEYPQIRLLRSPVNLGFAAANNRGFALAQGRYLILLNPDTQLATASLENSIRLMDNQPNLGLAGGRLISPEGVDQPSARAFPNLLDELLVLSGMAARFPRSRLCGHFDRTWADPEQMALVDWVPGAFAIMRHALIAELGGFDERFFLYYEEVDLCRRLKAAGWDIGYSPEIVVHHIGGASAKAQDGLEISASGSQLLLWRMRSALLYYRKHHGWLQTWLLRQLETQWHTLRHLKASWSRLPPQLAQAKQAAAGRHARLMTQAWQETQGGQVSPPHPW